MIYLDALHKKLSKIILVDQIAMMTIRIQIRYHQPQDNPQTHTCMLNLIIMIYAGI